VITIKPPTGEYGIQKFKNYSGNKYVRTNNEVTVDGIVYFIKTEEGEWIINPEL